MTGRLILLSGLPGVGKSTLGRALAQSLKAVHLEVDVAEAAIKASVLAPPSAEDAGYRVLAAQSKALIAQGHLVVADMVNADPLGRALWDLDQPRNGHAPLIVELQNSDTAVHRLRVEARHTANPATPTWAQVQSREWVAWDRPAMTLDAAHLSTADMVAAIQTALS